MSLVSSTLQQRRAFPIPYALPFDSSFTTHLNQCQASQTVTLALGLGLGVVVDIFPIKFSFITFLQSAIFLNTND